MRWATAVVVAACCAIACGRKSGPKAQTEPEPQAETAVQVENQNFLDMTVYALRGGERVRLGVVSGLSTRVFFLPPRLVGLGTDLQFIADPIGANVAAVSQRIYVTPGDAVQFIIPSRVP